MTEVKKGKCMLCGKLTENEGFMVRFCDECMEECAEYSASVSEGDENL